MNINKVAVTRKFNLGNYESLDLSAEATLNEKDNPLEVWQILRDNIEMEFVAMQKPKPQPKTPAQLANENTEKRQQQTAIPKDTICPKCGGKKKPEYELCYLCHEATKEAQQ